MSGKNKIILIGAGSFGQQIIDKQNNSNVIGWIEDFIELWAHIPEIPCVSNIENFISKENKHEIIIELGYNNLQAKENIMQTLLKNILTRNQSNSNINTQNKFYF
jgi:hypothetical protein